ncbi:isoleucine--tRNA ligase [bacterium]|nr:isoleucine--tRNA ligase [bacterium]
MFKNVPNPPNFPAMDEKILEKWDAENIFQRSIDQREGNPKWVFYDGPPGTNGPPHVGHLMQSALKDLWPRFESMRGKQVLRKAGWDTHGLPIELTADRDLKLLSKLDIENYGIAKYIEYCKGTVFRYKSTWEDAIRRIGRFLDLKDFYATYTTDYIQTDWWLLKQAWNTQVKPEFVSQANLLGNDRFLYKDYRISAWCPQQGTTLSNFEVAQGYKDVTEIALFPKFRVKGENNLFLAAWTTTAWTLLSNLAVAAGPSMRYVKIRITKGSKGAAEGERIIVAKSRLADLERFIDGYEVEETFPGSKLAGMEYEPLWEWQIGQGEGKRHFVIVDDFVTDEDGTGLVHLAPYGEDDFRLIKENELVPVLNVSENGIVEYICEQFGGKWFKDDDLEIDILRDLAHRGLLLGKEKHEHTYPFHYKTGSPLMYFPRPGWFIRARAMRDEMMEANSLINWYPERIRDGRFGKWLENVKDWNITRERFWGSPLPIWSSEDNEEAICVGSIEELNHYLKRQGDKELPPDADLHKPGIDEIVLKSDSGRELHRENFVLDSWYNAGIMPWGQVGYPVKEGSVEYLEHQYPADFICEGLDQTRGWFYSLLACSTLVALSQKDKDKTRWSSYKNVICTDLVLDDKGEKMSKSKGNVVPPIPIMEQFGADAVRWSFYRNNPWNPIRFGEEALTESLRQVFIPLWNAYSFFVTYANVDEWEPGNDNAVNEATLMDRWILTAYNDLVSDVTEHLGNYDVMPAAASITDFVDRLTNWYIRRSRRRFWKSEEQMDKERAYRTLYKVLTGVIRVLAPFSPFITEEMYQNLVVGHDANAKDSIHLEDWAEPDDSLRDDELKQNMDLARNIVSLGHAARNDAKLKVRQPLKSLTVVLHETDQPRLTGLEDQILEELNVKGLNFVADNSIFISYRAKPNFKTLGPRFGKDMKKWAAKIEEADSEQIELWRTDNTVAIEGQTFEPSDVLLEELVSDEFVVKEESDLTVALDITLDDSLRNEGYVRELINKIQNKRKDSGLEVTQRITLAVKCEERLEKAIKEHELLIKQEVLAVKLTIASLSDENTTVKINDLEASITLEPV